jgi:hypothetical protein
MADLLSPLSNGMLSADPYTSSNTQASHNDQHITFSAMIYSSSQLDWATTLCLVDCKVTGLFARKKMTIVVLFLESTSLVKSASLNPTNNT